MNLDEQGWRHQDIVSKRLYSPQSRTRGIHKKKPTLYNAIVDGILQLDQKIKALQKETTKSKLGGSKQSIKGIKKKKDSKIVIEELRKSASKGVFLIENEDDG